MRPCESLYRGVIAATVLACLSTAGCDTSVDAFIDSDRTYSIFGFLHAEQDTHWVRVEALRDSILLGADALDGVTVTLRNDRTGEPLRMTDSVFILQGAPAHNFFVPAEVSPGDAFSLSVEGLQAVASASTLVPERIPDPRLSSTPVIPVPCPLFFRQLPLEIAFTGIEHIVALEAVYTMRNGDVFDELRVSYVRFPVKTSQGFRASIPWAEDVGVCPSNLESFDLFVASGSSDWPFAMFSHETLARPDVASNVDGGTGYFGSVVSRVIHVPVRYQRL